jgi:hypothetical protein
MEEVTDKHLEHFHEVAAEHHATQAKAARDGADACDALAKTHPKDPGFLQMAAALRKSADSHDAMGDFHKSSQMALKFVIAADLRKAAELQTVPSGTDLLFQELFAPSATGLED